MNIYVLQVLTGKEERVRRDLEKQFKEQPGNPQTCRIIHPRRELIQRKNGVSYKKNQTLFPGYLFLEIPELEPEHIRLVMRRPATMHFLPSRVNIRALGDEDLEILKPFLKDNGLTPLVDVEFDENERIVIKEGPLKGYEGRIVKVDRRRRRMKVQLSMYGEGFPVDFGYRDVSKSR